MKTKAHIKYLLDIEKADRDFMWNRTGPKNLTISYFGYKHFNLNTIQEALLKLGCRYDFDKSKFDIEHYDKACSRTFVHLIEP